MIIFDDYCFINYVNTNGFSMISARHQALRSAARVIPQTEEYRTFVLKHMPELFNDCETENDINNRIDYYTARYSSRTPVIPHDIFFSKNELMCIQCMPNKISRKVNFALLFLFKYFDTHNIKVTLRDIRTLTANTNRCSWKDVHLLENILLQRDSLFSERIKPTNFKLLKDCSENDKILYRYEGDACCCSSIPFKSNLCKEYERLI